MDKEKKMKIDPCDSLRATCIHVPERFEAKKKKGNWEHSAHSVTAGSYEFFLFKFIAPMECWYFSIVNQYL